MTTVRDAIEHRAATQQFDPSRALDDAEVRELVRLATLAPSAYNFQNWSFVAVRSADAKARLRAAAYGQPKISDAPVTFVIAGTLNAHRTLAARLAPSVEAGLLPAPVVDAWVSMAAGSHEGNPVLQRDEAFRSASLAAMTLMLAAAERGLVTGPMSGYDPAKVSEAVGLGADEVPVVLVAVGHAAPGNAPQKPRRPVEEVLRLA
ncbi:MAG: nitroreductase family protein [Burkholderiales bacterium]|jgi:nitroreductase